MSNQITQVTPELYQYLLSISVQEHPLLLELRKETKKLYTANMQIAPEQGQFLQLIIKLLGAINVIEVGTYTGYSSLAMALALPKNGKIIACDTNESWTSIAKSFWGMAGVQEKISLKLAPAKETLEKLIAMGQAESFDLVFIDADKINYQAYYEKSLKLIKDGGLIIIDNVLWDGKVANDNDCDAQTQCIKDFNSYISQDKRVDISLIPLGDGLMLARKKP